MKKRTTNINRHNLPSNSRRRQLLKRVHQKVIARRQSFQILEATEETTQCD